MILALKITDWLRISVLRKQTFAHLCLSASFIWGGISQALMSIQLKNLKKPLTTKKTPIAAACPQWQHGGWQPAPLPARRQRQAGAAVQTVCSLECCQGPERSDAGGGPGGEIAHRMCRWVSWLGTTCHRDLQLGTTQLRQLSSLERWPMATKQT